MIASLGRLIGHLRLRARLGREGWRDRTLWALDLETGGLDPGADPILSVGMVPVRHGAVVLGECRHTLVRPEREVGEESLGIHHILPDDLVGAPPPAEVLRELAPHVDGGVLIVHQRSMDVPFLLEGFRRADVRAPRFLVIDTVRLLLRYAHRHGHLTPEKVDFPTGLAEARARFGLPPHRHHEALSDAVATAELFLVLAGKLGARRVGQLL